MPGITTPEAYADIPFPVHGIDSSRAFAEEPAGTTPDATNVRTFEPATLRARGGARPGLERFIDQQLPLSFVSGSRLIQHVNTVVQVDGTALLNNYDFLPADLADPSDAGPSSLWPPDQSSRNPGWTIPTGGTGIPPNKNAKRSPLIVWADPANINVGTALSSTQLNAVAKDPRTMDVLPGSYSYDPASGATLPAGTDQTLTVHFTPSDTATYKNSYKTVLIDVVQPLPTEWAFVQAAGSGISGQSAVSAPSDNVTIGNLLIVGVFVNAQEAPAIAPLTDTLGTVYHLITNLPVHTGLLQFVDFWLYYGIAPATGPNTVTATATLGNPLFLEDIGIVFAEYSGNTASPLDSFNTGTSFPATGSVSTGVIPVAGQEELLVAFFGGCSPDSGTTRISNGFGALTDIFPLSAGVSFPGSGGSVGGGQVQLAIGASFKKQ